MFLILSLMKNGSQKLDPKFFLSKLGSLISRAKGKPFIVNQPQDASEVLQYILSEIVKDCPESYKMISSKIANSSTCNTCLSDDTTMVTSDSILVPLADSLESCISSFLLKDAESQSETRFCNFCNCEREFFLERYFSVLPDFLIINIDRNVTINKTTIKDDRRVCFPDNLTLYASCDNVISVRSQYVLKAVINHSGSTKSGHYTAHVKYSDNWFFCNDTLISKCKLSSSNLSTIAMLFFQRT